MSIPAPISQNHEFASRPLSYTQSTGDDPFSDYSDGGGGGQSSALQQYSYNRQLALSALQNGSLSPQEKQLWQKYLSDLDAWFQKYGGAAQGQDGWDPMSGGDISTNGGLYNGAASGGPSPDFQDSTKIVYEKGTDFSWNFEGNESRTVYIYQQNVELGWQYASGQVKISKEFDSFLGKEVTVATVTDRDGKVHKVVMPNVKSLKTRTTDPKTQVMTDASFSGADVKLKNLSLDATEEDQTPKGTPPTKIDGDKATWDVVLKEGESVDFTPFYSENELIVKGNINIVPNGNEEYYTIEYQDGPPSRYVVKAYDDPTDRTDAHLKATANIDANLVKSITHAGDKSRVEFLGDLADPTDPHKINSNNEHAKKLSFGDGSGQSKAGSPVSEKYSSVDTACDEINGNTAVYNNPDLTDATIHADPTDDIDTHEIWAMGTVNIKGFTSKDTMKVVDYEAGPPPTWKVEVYKDGITGTKKDGYHKETFIIHGGKDTQVALFAMDPHMISFGKDEWKNKVKINGNDGSDDRKFLGEEATTVTTDTNGNTTATYDQNADPQFKNNWGFDGDTYTAEVDASGSVTIDVANQAEEAKVTIDGQWLVIEFTSKDKDGNPKILRYRIEKDKVDQVKILGLDESQILFSGNVEDKYAKKIVDASGKEFISSKIDTEMVDDLKGMSAEEVKKHLDLTWYGAHGADEDPDSDNELYKHDYSWAYEFVANAFNAIGKGMENGNWDDLKKAMDDLQGKINKGDKSDDERRANAFSALFMGLYSVLGKKKTQAVFAKLSQDDEEIFGTFSNGFKDPDAGGESLNLNPWQASFEFKTDEADGIFDGEEFSDSPAHRWGTGEWAPSDLEGWTLQDVRNFIDEALGSNSDQ